jgi:DNA-binding response OmpR family regulator
MSEKNGRPLVIVIENDTATAQALCFLVEDWGYLCFAASSPNVMARTLGSQVAHVKAMIVDFCLDDGFTGEKAAAMLTTAIGHQVPTIMTTAHPALADRQGRYPVLPKPFNPDVLRLWLEANIGKHASSHAA